MNNLILFVLDDYNNLKREIYTRVRNYSYTITSFKRAIFIFIYHPTFYTIEGFLKNITRKGNLKYMGYKIKFYVLLFRFGPTDISENYTISKE